GYFDTRQERSMRMSLEWASQLSKRNGLLLRVESSLDQSRVERGRLVPGGEENTVPSVPAGITWIVAHLVHEKHGRHIHDGKRSSGMARAGGMDAHQVQRPHTRGTRLQLFTGG